MHSFLIVSQTTGKGEETSHKLLLEHNIHPLDQHILIAEKTIGIEDIRTMQKNLSLFPLKGEKKAIIISRADLLTIAAQHALLKTLEEPPAHTIIILIAQTKEYFLSTVLSRCTLIAEKNGKKEINQKEKDTYETFLHLLPHLSVAKKLEYAQTFCKTKETALTTLENLVCVAREQLLTSAQKEWARSIRTFQKTYTLLQYTNTNPRVAMEHMLFSF